MAFELPALPYPYDALSPHMSAETLELHHDKHHRAYVEALNELVKGTAFANRSLEEIIRATAKNPAKAFLFNNAAQAWNHEFFFRSMRPKGGGEPPVEVMDQIGRGFGSFAKFRDSFITAAKNQFGSGWAWMTLERGKFKVVATANADTPIAHGHVPLAVCDVWEHAYYLDYRNRRADFVAAFFERLIDWDFVARNLARHADDRAA